MGIKKDQRKKDPYLEFVYKIQQAKMKELWDEKDYSSREHA